jgi:hypothetical protein
LFFKSGQQSAVSGEVLSFEFKQPSAVNYPRKAVSDSIKAGTRAVSLEFKADSHN